MTQQLSVVARFIRIEGVIFNVRDISRVWECEEETSDGTKYWMTYIKYVSGGKDSKFQFGGKRADEFWEALQLGSTDHLGPNDKLRDYVAL